MSDPSHGLRPWRAARWILGLLLKIVGSAAALLVLLAVGFTWYGLPTVITEHLMRNVDTGSLAVKARRVQLDLRHGLRFRGATIHLKRDIGPPILEAEDLVLSISPRAIWRGGQPLRGMIVRQGALRRSRAGGMTRTERKPLTLWLEIEACDVLGFKVEAATLTYRANARNIWYDNMRGIIGEGTDKGPFKASVHLDTVERRYDGHIQSRFNLSEYHGFFDEFGIDAATEVTRRFRFENVMPRSELIFRGAAGSSGFIEVDASFDMPACHYRDTACDQFLAALKIHISGTNSSIRLDPVRFVRDERFLEATATLYPRRNVIDFQVDSTLHPETAARIIDPGLVDALQPFTFGESTTIYARGRVVPSSPELTDVSAEVHGTGLGWGKFVTEACSFSLDINGSTTSVNRIEGELYNGKVTGRVRTYPDASGTNRHFSVAGRLEAVRLKDLLANTTRKDFGDFAGLLTLTGYVRGKTASGIGPPAEGRVKASIRHGRLFSVPFFGGLTALLARKIPGLGGLVGKQEAAATFEIRDGAARTKNLHIDGNVLRLEATGKYFFDGRLDFDVHVTLAKKNIVRDLLRIPLELLNEAFFETMLSGTTDDPHWYLKRFSRDLFKKFGLFDKKDKESEEPKDSAVKEDAGEKVEEND